MSRTEAHVCIWNAATGQFLALIMLLCWVPYQEQRKLSSFLLTNSYYLYGWIFSGTYLLSIRQDTTHWTSFRKNVLMPRIVSQGRLNCSCSRFSGFFFLCITSNSPSKRRLTRKSNYRMDSSLWVEERTWEG